MIRALSCCELVVADTGQAQHGTTDALEMGRGGDGMVGHPLPCCSGILTMHRRGVMLSLRPRCGWWRTPCDLHDLLHIVVQLHDGVSVGWWLLGWARCAECIVSRLHWWAWLTW